MKYKKQERIKIWTVPNKTAMNTDDDYWGKRFLKLYDDLQVVWKNK